MFTTTTIRKLAAFAFLFPFTALLFIQTRDSQALAESNFLTAEGTQFVVNRKHLYINGFNSYWLVVMASYPSGGEHVTSAFQQAASLGMTLARTWAFGDGGCRPLQGKLGSYNEEVLKGLDFVVSEPKKHGIYLILSLVDNYPDSGGRR